MCRAVEEENSTRRRQGQLDEALKTKSTWDRSERSGTQAETASDESRPGNHPTGWSARRKLRRTRRNPLQDQPATNSGFKISLSQRPMPTYLLLLLGAVFL